MALSPFSSDQKSCYPAASSSPSAEVAHFNNPAKPPRLPVMGLPREECGVFGVAGDPNAAYLTYLGLYALQHRGHETAGIVAAETVADGEQSAEAAKSAQSAGNCGSHAPLNGRVIHRIHRGMGTVRFVFSDENLERLKGATALGHVRYSTTGQPIPSNTQPLASSLRFGPVALAHNGNLTNALELRDELKREGAIFQTTIDSEVILHLLSRAKSDDFEGALQEALQRLEGAFSLTLLHEDTLYAVRDPHALRPLIIGRMRGEEGSTKGGAWVAGSETVAFDLIEAERLRDVEPGEVVRMRAGEEPVSLWLQEKKPTAHCIFELVYFSRPDSFTDGFSVQTFRERLGAELWKEAPADVDLVIGVPDSSTAAAIGFAEAAGLPFRKGLIRSHYVGRTFIEPTQEIRDLRAKLKYNPVRALIEGKRLAVIDDSIVRGTTSKKILRMLLDAGATEVHFRITSPPWRHPCFYGIDTPDEADLLAHARTVEDMREVIGSHSLEFLSPEALLRVASEGQGWCTACFTGNYPTPKPQNISKDILSDAVV